jgi:biotin carboxyl carrier protein
MSLNDAVREMKILAPMPGVIVQYEVKLGDRVEAEDAVVILVAMKMDNVITSPVAGTVKSVGYKSGDHVAKDAVLVVIGI